MCLEANFPDHRQPVTGSGGLYLPATSNPQGDGPVPSNHSIDLRTESGMTVEDVQFSFDVALSKVRKRPFSEGYRFSVELPAVLDLLDAVADGKQSAVDTRKVLLDAVNVLYDEAGCYEHRSEEHTSELQSRGHLVCRLLLEKK